MRWDALLPALLRFPGKYSTCFEVVSAQWKCGIPASMSEVVDMSCAFTTICGADVFTGVY